MKTKTVFYCTECGNETPKWAGRCPACGAWNSIVEQTDKPVKSGRKPASARAVKPVPIMDIGTADEIRFSTGMGELDRVLGGGAVKGSLVLVGGAPGIGKSTLMLQICKKLGEFSKVLYVSGEESAHQLKLRAQRLDVESENLYVLSETCLGNILECVQSEQPDVLIVDSIQTLYNEDLDSPAGGVGQVKDCTMALMQLAKGQGVTVFVIGHVNKEGSIAGPKVLEHMVDCVLYFEGDQHMTYRILRAAKNRFGATNEIGVFEMMDRGLREVENPSEMLLSGRPKDAPGTCVTCAMEGARPVLAEVQALIAPASASNPRRMSNGFDYNRATMLLAVLEKRGGLKVSQCDAYLNGGPGGGSGHRLQLSGQAGAGPHGGHRRGGALRRDPLHQPSGAAADGGAPAGLHPVHGPGPAGPGDQAPAGAGAAAGAEYFPGAAAAGGPKVSKYFPTDEGVFNAYLMKYKILLQEKIAFFIEYQTPALTICTHRSML